MRLFRYLGNIFVNCGVSSEEYKSVKKMAYAANFRSWKYLHILITVMCGFLVAATFFYPAIEYNRVVYITAFCYNLAITIMFFKVFKEDSLIAQLLIYVTMIAMLCAGLLISVNSKNMMAVSFNVFIVAIPMFMIDRPYFVAILLTSATSISVWHSYMLKIPEAATGDLLNGLLFLILGIIINCFYNALRVKEFLLQKKLEEERDTDSLTGLMNKSALMASVEEFIGAESSKGVMIVLDIDNFKKINDFYGHPEGDKVLDQLGHFLASYLKPEDIKGRFGGDEFILLLKDADTKEASEKAQGIVDYVNSFIHTPNKDETVGVSMGLAEYSGTEKNYDDLFRKADTALYASKNTGRNKFTVYIH